MWELKAILVLYDHWKLILTSCQKARFFFFSKKSDGEMQASLGNKTGPPLILLAILKLSLQIPCSVTLLLL